MGALAKRALDIFGATMGLIVLAIPFALIALAIKLDSRGPVFFRRERAGQFGQPFVPWKFRTMINDAIAQGQGTIVFSGDDRITRVGKFLRATSFDELPQLANVFTGEMSMIGPRPGWVYQAEVYDEFQRGRLRAKPGMTGLAAVKGRNSLSWEKRIEWDNYYIENWSFCMDLKILGMTPWKTITREGIYGEGGVNPDLASVDQPIADPTAPDDSADKSE
jgi:undecaprenyl phosphate N,N'-diacetylbacillosamine 1-phosphate transferase